MDRFWLMLALLSGLMPLQLGYTEERVSVSERISWDTVLKPELHLLVANLSRDDLSVAIQIGGWIDVSGTERIECALHGDAGPRQEGDRVVPSDIFDLAHSRGVLPAGGWIHRSWPLGSSSLWGPCRVPYRVVDIDSGKVLASGSFNTNLEPEAATYQMPDARNLTYDTLLEKWEPSAPMARGGQYFLLRVRLDNAGDRTRVSIVDRAVKCSTAASARWVLEGGPLARQSFGPTRLEKGESHVFVLGLQSTRGDISECFVEASLEAALSGGIEFSFLRRLVIPLRPKGLYAGYQ